jgi:hypothetical protein
MRYPPPPWRLAGPSANVTGLVPIAAVRDLVPADLDIVAVRPGLTVGAVVVADYQERATFPYSELAVMPAIVRYRGVRGPWISHIWVNSTPSLQGGREMWGLHKEHADFAWDFAGRTTVSVADAGGAVCRWSWSPPRRRIPFPARMSGLGSVAGDRRRYSARGLAWLRRTPVAVEAPDGSVIDRLTTNLQRSVTLAGDLDLRFGDIRILAPPDVTPAAAPGGRTT